MSGNRIVSSPRVTPQMALQKQREQENQKWYVGDQPTRGETLAQISRVYAQDPQRGMQAYESFVALSNDPSSAMYSPYMRATNGATQSAFAQYGVDVRDVNDDWFNSYSWLKSYNRVGSTGNVLGTAKSATDYQNMASLYADLYDQEQNTKKAETEWAAMQNEVRYWASRSDLNMSDEEILNKVNWNNYPTLAKMEEGRASGAPMLLTRAVGYDKDLLRGVIYQARNGGGSGDLLMDSADYYSGAGNRYAQDDNIRARFTYGSDSYNPYSVSGTINDIGLYFGQSSFDRNWLKANADILNGYDETAKKNYHKVQSAVALTEEAEKEFAELNNRINLMIDKDLSAENIMSNIDRALEDGTYPTLNKLQSSLATGKLLETSAPISFDYNTIRSLVNQRVNARNMQYETTGGNVGAKENLAQGVSLVNESGTAEEKAFFDSMSDMDFEERLDHLLSMFEASQMDPYNVHTAYSMLADSFNKKWANQAEDVTADYAKHQEAVKAYFDAELAIERSPEYKRLRELGYTGEVNDYAGVNAFLETIDEAEYDAIWEPLHDMYSDLAQADYTQDWNYMGGETGRAYRDDYAALEAFRRRAQIEGDESVVPILNKGEEYSVMDYAGVTADDYINSVMQSNEGVAPQEAASHVATALGEENAQLVKEISTLETAGYKGDILDNKKRKLDANQRLLTGVEYYNLQDNADYAENVAAGADLIDTTKVDPDSYKVTVDDDGKVSLSLMVYNHMTEAEKERMKYLAATNPEDAKEYLLSLTDDTYGVIPARVSGSLRDAGARFAKDHPVLATAASVVTSPLQLAGTIYSSAQTLRGKEINPNSRFMGATNFIGQTRAQVKEDIDKTYADNPVMRTAAQIAFAAVTSGLESLAYGAAGKAGLPFMIASNASAVVQDATSRGASTEEALAVGAVSAIIEYATEKIPFDELVKIGKGSKAAGKTLVKRLQDVTKQAVKTGAQDAAGEALSEALGNVADQYIMKDKSHHALAVEQYLSDNAGATEEEAERAVIKSEFMDVLMAGATGFLSSGGSVAVRGASGVTRNNSQPVALNEADVERVPASEDRAAAAPVATAKDQSVAQKSALLMRVALDGVNPSSAITAALMDDTDATSTVAKAVTLDLQRVFGDNTASALSEIYGAAYDAGITDQEITAAIKKHLSLDDGKVQLQELVAMPDGISTGKVKAFVDQVANSDAAYTMDRAHEVLVNEQMRVILSEGSTYEGLHAARRAEETAKEAYTKAQQATGKIEKQRQSAVGAMSKAKTAYDESLTHPNGNVQTSVQHDYFNAIDNVANYNSALEAARRREQEAKAKYDAAIRNYKDLGQRVLTEARAKAEKAVEQALKLAEDKTVNDVMNALGSSDSVKPEAPETRNVAPDARRRIVEQMRADGLLDELTEINRQIAEYEQKLAGTRKKNSLAKSIQRAQRSLERKKAEIVATVDALVNEEMARNSSVAYDPVQGAEKQEIFVSGEDASAVMSEVVNDTGDTVTIPHETEDTVAPSVAPESTVPRHDEALKKYGRVAPGEKPVRDIPIARKISDELKTMRAVRTAAEAFTDEQLPAEVIEEIVVDERATYQADTNAKQIAWAQNQLAQGYDHAVGVWESAIEGGNIPNAKQVALGSMLVHEAVGRGDMAMAQKTIVELAEAETRAGQTTQASRILKKLGNNALLYYAVRAESEINRRLAKKGVHIAIDEVLADNLMKAKTDQEKMDATQAIINDLAAKLPRTWRDKANALAYLSMLSSPVTHIKNFAGNAANIPLAAIENAVGTAIDRMRPKDKRTHVLITDKAYLDFAKKDYAENKDSDKSDRYKITAGAVYAARTPFADKGIGKALNKVSDVESEFLRAGDRVYKNMYYPRLMASYLQAKGVDLKNIPHNTLLKAREYAERKSKEYLYQDDSAAARWIQKGYEIPVFGEALRAVMPFAKTPINVAKRSMEFSVIGGVANIAYQGKKNGWGSNEVVEAISKSVAGGAMHVVGFLLANAGILVPSLGDDPEDQMAELRGSQAYALEIGNTSYTISWAGPAAIEMLLGAEIAKAFDGKFTVDELVGSGLNLLNPLLDNTFLDGIVDLLSIGQYAQGGADLAGEVVAQVASSYMAQYFPAVLGALARTIDATRRSTTTDPNSPVPESLQYQFAKMLNKIPRVSMTRPAWTDEFGQTDTTDGWMQRALENLVFPWYQNELKSDDIVLNEINKIYVATGGTDKALIPEMADKSFSESNAKHKLGGDDYAKMNELHGKIQREALEDLFSRPEWAEIDPYIKAEMIKDVYSYADNASRVDYVSTSPFSDSWQAEAYKSGDLVDAVLGRAEKHAQSTWGKLYAAEVVGFALRGDWESAIERAMEMTIVYPLGASLSTKQARAKIESELKTKLQEGDAEIAPEEYDAVLQLYALGYIDSTIVDELMAQ